MWPITKLNAIIDKLKFLVSLSLSIHWPVPQNSEWNGPSMPQAVGVKRPPYRGEVEDLEEKEDVHPNHDGQTLSGVGEGPPVSPAP